MRDYELIPLGDDIGAALGARTSGRPDVVARAAGRARQAPIDNLAPLPEGVWQDAYERDLVTRDVDGLHYALPFKLANASVVWYRKGSSRPASRHRRPGTSGSR